MSILSITLPIFLLIGIGYLCVWRGLFTPDQIRGMGRFVIMLALPALLFRSLAGQKLHDVLEWRYLVVYALGSVAVLLGGLAYARAAHGLGTSAATMRGFGMATSNSGFIGFPLAMQVIGPHAAVPLALTFIVENAVVIPLTLTLAESGMAQHAGPGQMAGRIAGSLVRSPLIIAIVLACVAVLLGVHPIAPVAKLIDLLAGASGPVALFVIGGSLVGLSARGLVRPVMEVAIGKLILHPLAMVLLLLVIPVANPELRHTAVLLASVPMLSIYPIIAERYGEARFCAAALLVTTALSFVTVSGVLWLLQSGYLA